MLILGSTNVQNGNATSSCPTSPVSNTLMSALPSDLRAVMEPFTVWTCNASNMATDSPASSYTTDYLPLIAEYEMRGEITPASEDLMGGTPPSEVTNQVQYTFWKNSGYIRPKAYNSDSEVDAFFRTPMRRTHNDMGYFYHNWGAMVEPDHFTPDYGQWACDSLGVCPIFKI